jgi:hypothetical protein
MIMIMSLVERGRTQLMGGLSPSDADALVKAQLAATEKQSAKSVISCMWENVRLNATQNNGANIFGNVSMNSAEINH